MDVKGAGPAMKADTREKLQSPDAKNGKFFPKKSLWVSKEFVKQKTGNGCR